MGVNISHIIRNNFRDTRDMKSSKQYAFRTAELLRSKLYDEVFVYRMDFRTDISKEEQESLLYEPGGDASAEFTIRLENYHVELTLRKGFWVVESFVHYCQITNAKNSDHFWLREHIADIVRALGEHEVWHATEYDTWNGIREWEKADFSFEDWLQHVQATKDGIAEFNPAYWIERSHNGNWPNDPTPPIFHDDLSDLDQLLATLQQRWSDYQIIGNACDCNKELYRAVKKGKVVWLNVKSGRTKLFHSIK